MPSGTRSLFRIFGDAPRIIGLLASPTRPADGDEAGRLDQWKRRSAPELSLDSLHTIGIMRGFALLLAALVIAGCGQSAPVVSPSPGGSACSPNVVTAVLPGWARAGFSDPAPTMPYEVGRSGEIAALVFGFPLQAPPSKLRNNKILWVMHEPTVADRLDISAQRMDGATAVGDPVKRSVAGGPGPSIVDLPAAGCWRFTLSWGDRTDSLDLEYGASST